MKSNTKTPADGVVVDMGLGTETGAGGNTNHHPNRHASTPVGAEFNGGNVAATGGGNSAGGGAGRWIASAAVAAVLLGSVGLALASAGSDATPSGVDARPTVPAEPTSNTGATGPVLTAEEQCFTGGGNITAGGACVHTGIR